MVYALKAKSPSLPQPAGVAQEYGLAGEPGIVCQFDRGATLFSEGEKASHVYRVVTGAVRLSRTTADGRRQIIGFRLPGESVGFEWGAAYGLSAEAADPVQAVRSSVPAGERMAASLISALRRQLEAAQDHIVLLGRQTAHEKVASFLVDFARRSSAGDGQAFDLHVSREDIADYLGLTFETVSRVMSDLKRRRLIELVGARKAAIPSLAKLAAQVADAA